MPARERLDRRAGRPTAPRSGPWPTPGPGPRVRHRLSRSPPAGRFLPAASLAPGRWPRHRSRSAVASPPRSASSDRASRAAARSRKPASRLIEPGGPAKQTEQLISGRSQREEGSIRKNKSALPPIAEKDLSPPNRGGPSAEEDTVRPAEEEGAAQPADEDHVPPGKGGVIPRQQRRAIQGRRQAPYPAQGEGLTRQAGEDHPRQKVASRPLWAGGHLRLPRSGLRRWPVSANAACRYQRIRTS